MKHLRPLLAITLLITGCSKQIQTSKPEPKPRYASGPKYQLKTFGDDLLMFRPGTGETWAFNPKTRDWIALPKPQPYDVKKPDPKDPFGRFQNRTTNHTTVQKP